MTELKFKVSVVHSKNRTILIFFPCQFESSVVIFQDNFGVKDQIRRRGAKENKREIFHLLNLIYSKG